MRKRTVAASCPAGRANDLSSTVSRMHFTTLCSPRYAAPVQPRYAAPPDGDLIRVSVCGGCITFTTLPLRQEMGIAPAPAPGDGYCPAAPTTLTCTHAVGMCARWRMVGRRREPWDDVSALSGRAAPLRCALYPERWAQHGVLAGAAALCGAAPLGSRRSQRLHASDARAPGDLGYGMASPLFRRTRCALAPAVAPWRPPSGAYKPQRCFLCFAS